MKYRIDLWIADPDNLSLAGALRDMSEEVSYGNTPGNTSGNIQASNAPSGLGGYSFNIVPIFPDVFEGDTSDAK